MTTGSDHRRCLPSGDQFAIKYGPWDLYVTEYGFGEEHYVKYDPGDCSSATSSATPGPAPPSAAPDPASPPATPCPASPPATPGPAPPPATLCLASSTRPRHTGPAGIAMLTPLCRCTELAVWSYSDVKGARNCGIYAKEDKMILFAKQALPPTRDVPAWLVGGGGLADPWPPAAGGRPTARAQRGICAPPRVPACSAHACRPSPGLSTGPSQKPHGTRSVHTSGRRQASASGLGLSCPCL